MSAQPPTICRRCGFQNVPGDVFCGSCGAFLEWEGEAAEAVPEPAPAGDPDVPVVGGGTAHGAPPPPNPYQAQQPVQPVPAWTPPPAGGTPPPVGQPAAPSGAGLVRCPACGIANTPGRTFCQSCGAKLAEGTGRVGEVSAAQIAAAVSAPNRPPTPPAAPAGTKKGQGSGGKGGGGMIVVLVVLGLLVGGGLVAGAMYLGSRGGPSSDASAAPSSTAPSSTAPTDAPVASGESTAPTDAPTATPKAKAIAITGAVASSVVGDLAKFQPEKAIDGDPKTSWQEGAIDESGQWIEVLFDPATVTAVVIRNGYGASTALYKSNLRPRDVEISVGGAAPVKVRLKDTSKPQTIAVDGAPGAGSVRITILTTYPSVKTGVNGSPFDDAAISEISLLGVPGS